MMLHPSTKTRRRPREPARCYGCQARLRVDHRKPGHSTKQAERPLGTEFPRARSFECQLRRSDATCTTFMFKRFYPWNRYAQNLPKCIAERSFAMPKWLLRKEQRSCKT